MVKTLGIGEDRGQTLKVINYPRYNNAEREKAVNKARLFVDDLQLIGKVVKVIKGQYLNATGKIEQVKRRTVCKKDVLFFTVELLDVETADPVTLEENQINIYQ